MLRKMLRKTVNTRRAEMATSTRAMSSEARSRTRGRQPVLYVIYLSVLRHLLHVHCFPAYYPCRITTTTSAPKLAGQDAGTAEPQVPDRDTFNAQLESARAQITQCGIGRSNHNSLSHPPQLNPPRSCAQADARNKS